MNFLIYDRLIIFKMEKKKKELEDLIPYILQLPMEFPKIVVLNAEILQSMDMQISSSFHN